MYREGKCEYAVGSEYSRKPAMAIAIRAVMIERFHASSSHDMLMKMEACAGKAHVRKDTLWPNSCSDALGS